MKTISSQLQTHLQQTVTTLATIWRLTRTDGEEFFFTDHDQDLLVDGDTYKASSGYNRSAINNEVGLAVDNLDVEGVFNSDDITEVDLRAGLFDHAEVKVSLVNWSDLSQGQLKQRRGRLGEVVLTQQGIFRAELRGLTQQLSQNICHVYQAECRADLGDTKCTVGIKPAVIERSTAVTLGTLYQVPTGSTSGIVWDNLVNNGSFELDSEALYTTSLTSWEVVTGNVTITSDYNDLTPYEGSVYLCGGNVAAMEIKQVVGLESTFGVSLTQIDAGNVEADFSCYRANNAVDDTGRVLVQFLDSSLNPLSTMYDSGTEEITPEDTWVQRSASSVAVPANTRYVSIRFIGTRITGTILNSCIDNVELTLTDTVSESDYQEIYENRIYQVTTAGTTDSSQPSYDTTVGNPTTDGTAVLECVEAWTRHGIITQVYDRKTFVVSVSDSRAVDDWFNGGAIIFESGLNAGKVIEIREWTAATGEIILFLPVPFTLYAGTRVRLYPGCDKRLTTCVNKFDNVLNFRGEPFVPGQDELTSYASASSY